MSATRREDWPVIRRLHESGEADLLAMAISAPLFIVDGQAEFEPLNAGLRLPFDSIAVGTRDGEAWGFTYARVVPDPSVRDFNWLELHGFATDGSRNISARVPTAPSNFFEMLWDERSLHDEMRSYLVDFHTRDVLRVVYAASRHHVAEVRPREHNDRGKTRWKAPWCLTSLPRAVVLDGSRAPPAARTSGAPSAPTDREVRPHRRRGHYKTLRSERFKHKRGERVWVRPAWVGPREWVLGGTTYKVVTA